MRKLNMAAVKENLQDRFTSNKTKFLEEIKQLRTVVCVMCGGGMLGRFAANQPKDFYIDDRVGKLPYGKRQIFQAVEVLNLYLEVAGITDRSLPDRDYFEFHNCGVFW